MPEFSSPFGDERKPSPGEAAQQWAGFARMGLRLLGVELYEKEEQALATVFGAVLRAHPEWKDPMEAWKEIKGMIHHGS